MITDPNDDHSWLPHGVAADGVVLAHAAPNAVASARFLDGREAFADAVLTVPLEIYLEAARKWRSPPLSTICHVSFCGSTLMARLLDVPTRTIVYREPAIQIALADRHAAGTAVEELLAASSAAFSRPVNGRQPILKPTSWANSLLPLWVAAGAIMPVFITMAPRAFLVAVFRGGRERIGYVLRLAEHLSRTQPYGVPLIAAAASAGTSALDRAAALILTGLSLQFRLFADARRALHLSPASVIDAAEIFSDPAAAAQRIANAFGLDDIALNDVLNEHAKVGLQYSAESERSANAAVEAGNGGCFDIAMRWSEEHGLGFVV